MSDPGLTSCSQEPPPEHPLCPDCDEPCYECGKGLELLPIGGWPAAGQAMRDRLRLLNRLYWEIYGE